MAFSLGTISGILELRDQFTTVLANAEQRITGFASKVDAETKRTEGLTDGLTKIGGAATGAGLALTAGLTAPIALVGGLVGKLGIDAVESRNLMEVSFGSMIESADTWANALSKDLGLNRFEMEKTAGTMFNMVSSMGLGKTAAFDVSTGIVKLAADMASFRNISIDEALTKLKSGLVGETEPLKAIGILVDENTVKAYAYKNGIAAQGAELTAQQKVLARYGAIMQQTSNDQGDLARTMESPANQLRIMQSRITEAATSLGMSLVPMMSATINVVSKVVPIIQSVVEWFAKLPGPIQTGAIVLLGLVAAAGPALVIAGQLATAWAALLPIMNSMGGASAIAAKGMSFLGPAAAIVATAFAAWEVGKWIGNFTGLTDWVERLTGRMMGLSSAQIETGMAARKAADEHANQKEKTKDAADSTADLAEHLRQEIDAQNQVATSTTLAAQATKLAETRQKEHAKALFEVNEKIASAIVMTNNFTTEQEKLIQSYKNLGLSAGEIALKMGVSEKAIGHFLEVTVKSAEQTATLWREHYTTIANESVTSFDEQINNVKRWFDDEVAKLDKSDKNYQAHYDALAAVANDRIGKIGSSWDDLKNKSQESLQAQAEAAQRDYEKMLTSGLHFSKEALDEQLKKVKDLQEKLHGMGAAGKEAFDAMTESAKHNTSAMIKAAEEADKARAANRAMGGAFEVTRENFAQAAAGRGEDPGKVESFLKKGYSFEQALLWAKHPEWPPPEHPGPRVQGFAEGGIVTVGERGPERVALPFGSMVAPNGKDFARGGGTMINHYHITAPTTEMARLVISTIERTMRSERKWPTT